MAGRRRPAQHCKTESIAGRRGADVADDTARADDDAADHTEVADGAMAREIQGGGDV